MREANISDLLVEAETQIKACDALDQLEALRVKYLGRKSVLIGLLRSLGSLPPAERKQVGREANIVKKRIENLISETKEALEAAAPAAAAAIDYTLPGKLYPAGKRHLLTRSIDELCDIFYGMGFQVALGPEVETEYYNFDALNFPPDHPARDMQDTFYVGDQMLLRTHTSPVQIREFLKRQPPVKIIAPGRTYRQEAISSRAYCVFYQLEGFYVDYGVTFADLKGVLTAFAREYFGADVKLRFRPSFFPFTEPSAEVDISCYICQGKGCRVCKQEGWLEVLGCGMIDPAVFEAVGYDPEKYSGYAFGMGVDRTVMLKHKVDDIRLFWENDLRFLSQF